MDKKILIVSGDSFTFEKWNWPGYLKDNINYDINNSGMGCQGNGLISKKIIYNVDKVLKTISADDILVGVMWSAIDRTEFYLDDVSNYNNVDGWVENPTNIVDGVENKRWFITNSHWKTPKAKMWYEYFHTDIESMISFMYDVLSVQWYLEKHNIKYFMSTIIDIFENREQTINHPEIKYLYDMINFEYFLPIKGCREWVLDNYPDDGFPVNDNTLNKKFHPTSYGHEMFAKEVILPFLENKKLI